MKFFDLLYFLILSLSTSYMWSFATIFKGARKLVSKIPYVRVPILCPECCSFWVGFFVSFLYNPIVLDLNFFLLNNIFAGLATHLFACYAYKVDFNLDKDSIKFLNK